MLLKNLMEDKQLDFNQPLLSVRRFSSTVASLEAEGKRRTGDSIPRIHSLPVYKSELKSGPVRNPGTVPFLWERSPGRPKDESKSQTRPLERPPSAPKLPPGRNVNGKQPASNKVFESTKVTQSPHGNISSTTENVSSVDKYMTKYENSKEPLRETRSSDSEDSDEEFVDALDTLSRTESFFLNCSVSGVSGLDGAELKPSGIFSTDAQTRDFMMGRFLPAAQAIASETPQYAARKQPVPQEWPRQIKKVVSGDNQRPLYQYSLNNLPHYSHDKSESEDEDDYDGAKNSSAKLCGLFPRFSLKNSVFLLNPVPGMKMHPREPVSSVRRVRAKSSYTGSCIEPEKELARNAVYEQRTTEELGTAQNHNGKIKLNGPSSQITSKNDIQKSDGSALHRYFQGNSEFSPQHYFSKSVPSDEKGFRRVPEKSDNVGASVTRLNEKPTYNFQELLAMESTEQELGSVSPVVEKTLYIDSMHIVKSRNSTSSIEKVISNRRGDDFKSFEESKEREDALSVESSLEEIKQLNGVDKKTRVQRRSSDSVDTDFLSSTERSNHDTEADIAEICKQDREFNHDSITLTSSTVTDEGKVDTKSRVSVESSNQENSHGLIQDFTKPRDLVITDDGKIDLESPLKLKSSKESFHGIYSQLFLPLPLPKSPSESWLKRTLPTLSSKNSSLGSDTGSDVKVHDLKWETIVKSSNTHHGHFRFSEELLTPIPEA